MDFPPEAIRDCNLGIRNEYAAAQLHHMDGDIIYERCYKAVPHDPVLFTDLHISRELSLHRIIFVDSITSELKERHSEAFTQFLKEDNDFPPEANFYHSKVLDPVSGAWSFAMDYYRQVGKVCTIFASKLLLNPKQPTWFTPFSFYQHSIPWYLAEMKLEVAFDANRLIKHGHKELSENENLQRIRQKSDTTAVFDFLPPSSTTERILSFWSTYEDLGYNASEEWSTARTECPQLLKANTRTKPLDGPDAWWQCHIPPVQQEKRFSTSNSKMQVWIPDRVEKRLMREEDGEEDGYEEDNEDEKEEDEDEKEKEKDEKYPPHPSTFLQRAWCRAVENDATFIVFSVGRRERIGIRHRESNTLILTPLILPLSYPYMQTHMALHWAILKDALERSDMPMEPAASVAGKKRRHDESSTSIRSSKRLNGENSSAYVERDPEKEIASCNILLVSFDFGPFHSPTPSSFLRVSPSCHPDFISQPVTKVETNREYPLHQCLHFVATERLGSGSSGTCFRGILEVRTPGGDVLEERAVLKMPLGIRRDERKISWEYTAYQTIHKAGIKKGVLKVHGVFEDVQTGYAALLMQDGGTTLAKREFGPVPRNHDFYPQVTLSTEEFESLLSVVRDINFSAHVIHNDVKPENITVDDDGNIFLIDFDCAFAGPFPKYLSIYGDESEDTLVVHAIFRKKFKPRYL